MADEEKNVLNEIPVAENAAEKAHLGDAKAAENTSAADSQAAENTPASDTDAGAVSADESGTKSDDGEQADDGKKGKKKNKNKADSGSQAAWRGKDDDKPLFLDTHKIVFWVLVGLAVLGLVFAIIPFAVKGDDSGSTGSPWNAYVSRLSSAGYLCNLATPDNENSEMLGVFKEQIGYDCSWVIEASTADNSGNVMVMALADSDKAFTFANYMKTNNFKATSVGNVAIIGGTDADVTAALGSTYTSGNSNTNPWLNADFGHEYVNDTASYVFDECPKPGLLFYYDTGITNTYEETSTEIVSKYAGNVNTIITNEGALASPGTPEMIFIVHARNSSETTDISVLVLRYATAAEATQAKANVDSYDTLGSYGVGLKNEFLVLVSMAGGDGSLTQASLAEQIIAFY